MSTTSLSHYLGGNDMKTTTQELNQYITRLFQLSNNETWECEALEEATENILPTRFVDHTPLAHLTLETYTYYNDELHELSIYPFLMYANNHSSALVIWIILIWTFYTSQILKIRLSMNVIYYKRRRII